MPINRWCSQITVCVSLSFCFSNLVVPQRQGSQLINIWLCYWARHSLGRTPCSAEEWGERGEIWAQWTESKCLCREDEQRDTVFQLNACHLQHTAAIPSIKGQQTLEEFWKCKSRCCHPVHTRWVLLELSSPKLYMAYYSVEKKNQSDPCRLVISATEEAQAWSWVKATGFKITLANLLICYQNNNIVN